MFMKADRPKVLPLHPPTTVESIISDLPSRNFKKLVVAGQTEDGYWNFQFGDLTGKVEALGVLEFMKLEIWHSMVEAE